MKPLLLPALLLGVLAVLLWFAPHLLGRRLDAAELAAGGVVLAFLGARWMRSLRRRQRKKIEAMRDSALW